MPAMRARSRGRSRARPHLLRLQGRDNGRANPTSASPMTMPQSVRPASAPAPERLSRYTACLLGAALGMAPLPARWLEPLELAAVTRDMGGALANVRCQAGIGRIES